MHDAVMNNSWNKWFYCTYSKVRNHRQQNLGWPYSSLWWWTRPASYLTRIVWITTGTLQTHNMENNIVLGTTVVAQNSDLSQTRQPSPNTFSVLPANWQAWVQVTKVPLNTCLFWYVTGIGVAATWRASGRVKTPPRSDKWCVAVSVSKEQWANLPIALLPISWHVFQRRFGANGARKPVKPVQGDPEFRMSGRRYLSWGWSYKWLHTTYWLCECISSRQVSCIVWPHFITVIAFIESKRYCPSQHLS